MTSQEIIEDPTKEDGSVEDEEKQSEAAKDKASNLEGGADKTAGLDIMQETSNFEIPDAEGEPRKLTGHEKVVLAIGGFDEAIRYMDWTFEQCF